MKVAFIPLMLVALFAPYAVSAHETGESYETQDKRYTIDVGYTTKTPEEAQSVLFDFELKKLDTVPDYSDVWVKIEDKNKAVVFASAIHNSPFGGPRLTYVFPKPGSYIVSVRYEKGDVALAETTFPINVTPVATQKTSCLSLQESEAVL